MMRYRLVVVLLVVALATAVVACSILPSPVATGTSQPETSVQPAASPTGTPAGAFAASPTVAGGFACPVTPASTDPTPYGGQVPPVVGWYANDALWGGLAGYEPWRVGDNKVAWWRKVQGILVIEGRRLDAPAPPLQADVSGYYGLSGFQPSGITFPSTGCWEIVGYLVTVKAGVQERVGDQLRFVVRVDW